MQIRSTAALILSAAFASSCSNINQENPDGVYLQSLNSSEIPNIPAQSLGSPYSEMMMDLYTNGSKTEYETESQYQARLNDLPSQISKKYGSYFVFKLHKIISNEVKYNAETGFLYFAPDLSSGNMGKFTIGFEKFDNFDATFSVNPENCQKGLKFKLSPSVAQNVKENMDAAYYVAGSLDLSKRGYTPSEKAGLLDLEKIPGVKYLAFQKSNGKSAISISVDFKADQFLVVDQSNGSIIAKSSCSK